MQVSNIQNNQFYRANNVRFGAISNLDKALKGNETISRKSIKLLNDLNTCIEKEWSAIKKGDRLAPKPIFRNVDDLQVISFEPDYNQKYPALMIEIDDGKIFQKILINRDNPNEFKYEKNVRTDHGSATLRSYNSKHDNNNEINRYVNNVIENNLEKILLDRRWNRLLNKFDDAID